ncbi:MAG TPA: chemotaxis protein CheW [Polyangiaceae bacterium]|nr:chemotaxis protein CheW [Polyangiaceae bacterium]
MSNAPSHARRVLRQRAERLARAVRSDSEGHAELEMAVCSVGDELFGFPVEQLREIVALPAITRLPGCPDWMLGIAQVRGTLLSIIDLGRFYRISGAEPPQHVAIVNAPEGPLGFTVERVVSYRRVLAGELGGAGSLARAEGRATLGVTGDLVVVLDLPRLVAQPELVLT